MSGSSTDHALLDDTNREGLNGWLSVSVAKRQHEAFAPLLQDCRDGNPRQDFLVAAKAIAATGSENPLVVEIGCGSGYYSEVLPLLLGRPLRYVGIDYSASMTAVGRSANPCVPFVTGDARNLPLKSACCDISFSGVSLMHIPEYEQAIAESVRIARHWCVFHTVPVMANRPTTLLKKKAYGEQVSEVIFNQTELEANFEANGLVIQERYESIAYDVGSVVGEPTWTLTYLCRRSQTS